MVTQRADFPVRGGRAGGGASESHDLETVALACAEVLRKSPKPEEYPNFCSDSTLYCDSSLVHQVLELLRHRDLERFVGLRAEGFRPDAPL